ncbi:MAG: PTS sugar transporter subunit IIA [Phycisphaerales bacterium]
MRLDTLLKRDRVLVLDACKDRNELFARLIEPVDSLGPSAEDLIDALKKREALGPTSTPDGVAFPHAMLEGITETALVVALVKGGTNFEVGDHPHCDLIFCMFGSPARPWEHVQLLARLARISRGDDALDRLRACTDNESLYAALAEEDRRHV